MCDMIDVLKKEVGELKEMVNKVLLAIGGISSNEEKLMTKTELMKFLDISMPTLNKRLKSIDYKGVLVGETDMRYEKDKVLEALRVDNTSENKQ